jgi:TatD DNase family protein
MIFDSHTHLQFKAFDKDRDEVIQRLIDNTVKIINVGSCIENSYDAVKLAETYPFMWASVGIHPSHAYPEAIFEDDDEKSEIKHPQVIDEEFKKLALNNRVVAIGECGLDFSYTDKFDKEFQYDCFRKQIQLAKEVNKPIILHVRKVYLEAIEILKEEEFDNNIIFHFFKGKEKDLEEVLKMEKSFIGFSGVVSYDNSMDAVISKTPLDRILIETDAPYVAPVPKKGERNEPVYVKYVAEYIAKIKGISLEEVLDISYKNALKAFNIKDE